MGMLDSVFDKFQKKSRNSLESPATTVPVEPSERRVYVQCPGCKHMVDVDLMAESLEVCPRCGHHLRLNARDRLRYTVDEGTFDEWDADLTSVDFLHFPGYQGKLERAREKSGEVEAVLCGGARIEGRDCAIFVMNSDFMMGSMGSVVGEKITRCFERACELRLPVVGFTVSGGARMQEGATSLMQMAKTSAAVRRHSDAGLLYVAVLTDPTSGGVTASFAMEADVTLAEPGALVAFAGPRVIEQTIHRKLPSGFQSAEFQLEHGFVDRIVARSGMRDTLAALLSLHADADAAPKAAEASRADEPRADASPADSAVASPTGPATAAFLTAQSQAGSADASSEGTRADEATSAPPATAGAAGDTDGDEAPSAYDRVRNARSTHRATTLTLIGQIFDGFIELHGDRRFADDKAMVGGIAWLGDTPVTVIGTERGSSIKERVERNFGSAHPEGYRKALRLMRQAEKFGRPVVCFIDTAGAYCGIEAEERGQGQAIAENLVEMSGLRVPIVSVVIGEGGSGGALALGVGNRVWMLENSVYSVISPEGCASILYKDASKAPEAADALGLTADVLARLGIVDRVVGECGGDIKAMCATMASDLRQELDELGRLTSDELVAQRYDRFRSIGVIAQ
ncbi:MAG: acetyl-CoA carboxylase carboxyltransferase subunit alpha [Coriobacteriales bacterium]|jgi:acetyl-CoA carboxylase carboxyl transferase alpha subunit/acetyl-CoA carboxylase carboxyl transferase beta subunit